MKLLILLSLFFSSVPSYSQDSLIDTFMCRQMRGKSLSDLKLGLVQDCDLNRPFSSSVSGADLGSSTIMSYCCHRKKGSTSKKASDDESE